MILLHFPNPTIQAKNLLRLSSKLEINISCIILTDLLTSIKSYWSILRTLLSDEKTPIDPPLFVNGKFITEIKDKYDYVITSAFLCSKFVEYL